MDTSTWHHVCVTWNYDTDAQHIYVDGELDDLSPVWVYYGGRGDSAEDVVRIGFDCSGDATSDFSGRMDDVAIFDVTLTPEQVIELMHLPLPTTASNPLPYDGATDLLRQGISLSWKPGPSANTHNVYFGQTFENVNDASVDNPRDVLAGEEQTQNMYDPGLLEYGRTYYWRVDEVNGTPDKTVFKGNVWSFNTVSSLVVDDFESDGNRSPNRPFQTWLDGFGYSADEFFPVAYGGNGTGSGVGHDIWSPGSPYFEGKVMEQGITLEGSNQSMPLYYTNAGGLPSQADRIWASAQDWTAGGPDTLVMYFYGSEDNTGGPLFAKINGQKVTYPDSANLSVPEWHAWQIDLTSLGINLQAVTSLSLGVEDAGSGMILIDDLRLLRSDSGM